MSQITNNYELSSELYQTIYNSIVRYSDYTHRWISVKEQEPPTDREFLAVTNIKDIGCSFAEVCDWDGIKRMDSGHPAVEYDRDDVMACTHWKEVKLPEEII